MSPKIKVGKEASQTTGGELYFRTYQKLLRQRARIDREILKLQSKFLKAISRSKGGIDGKRKRYVARLNNTTTLVQAIRDSMVPDKEMSMNDILSSLEKKDLYHTISKYFYTMVNNKLNRDRQIRKVSRGVFVYRPRKRGKAVA